jgi:hypothetical protein
MRCVHFLTYALYLSSFLCFYLFSSSLPVFTTQFEAGGEPVPFHFLYLELYRDINLSLL